MRSGGMRISKALLSRYKRCIFIVRNHFIYSELRTYFNSKQRPMTRGKAAVESGVDRGRLKKQHQIDGWMYLLSHYIVVSNKILFYKNVSVACACTLLYVLLELNNVLIECYTGLDTILKSDNTMEFCHVNIIYLNDMVII